MRDLLACLAGVAVVATLAAPDWRARWHSLPGVAQNDLTACKSNMKQVGTALEMYSADFSGRYPLSLAPLTPVYLKTLPSRPAARQDTYSAGFQLNDRQVIYTLVCAGGHHRGVTDADPRYYSAFSVLERP